MATTACCWDGAQGGGATLRAPLHLERLLVAAPALVLDLPSLLPRCRELVAAAGDSLYLLLPSGAATPDAAMHAIAACYLGAPACRSLRLSAPPGAVAYASPTGQLPIDPAGGLLRAVTLPCGLPEMLRLQVG